MPLARERLIPQEEIGRPSPLILVILAGRNTRACWFRLSDICAQLDGTLVEADLGEAGIIGTSVDIEHVLHVPHELGILLGRDAPLLLQMGLQEVFLSVRRTNSSEMIGPS
jgi:hypothetical protein